MNKFASLCVVALVALLAALGLAPAAHAYPDVAIDLTVDRQVLYGGESFTATGTSDVTCDWNLEWNGVIKTGQSSDGSPLVRSYDAPNVTKITKIPLHGTCTYTQPTARKAAKAAAGAATWNRTIEITVLPRGSAVSPPDPGADLPNTGGPNILFLFAGVLLLGAGAASVFLARRRAESVDTVAGQA